MRACSAQSRNVTRCRTVPPELTAHAVLLGVLWILVPGLPDIPRVAGVHIPYIKWLSVYTASAIHML